MSRVSPEADFFAMIFSPLVAGKILLFTSKRYVDPEIMSLGFISLDGDRRVLAPSKPNSVDQAPQSPVSNIAHFTI